MNVLKLSSKYQKPCGAFFYVLFELKDEKILLVFYLQESNILTYFVIQSAFKIKAVSMEASF